LRVLSRAIFAVAAGVPVCLAGVAAGPAWSAWTARPALAAVPAATSYSTSGSLAGVAAASDRDAWAVGHTGTSKVLMLHWNGSRWARVTSPKVLAGRGELSAVSVVSATDAWAVGSTGSDLHPRTLILHWNGAHWSAVTSPAPVANGTLNAVTVNSRGGWAVGWHSTGPSVPDTSPVIFQLTGTTWARVDAAFGSGSGIVLDGVATTTAGDTFATGLYTGMITGVLASWSGSSWSFVSTFPEQGTYHWLNAIAAGPHGTAFAVGENTSGSVAAISIRWTGTAWVKAPAPSSDSMNAVAVTRSGTAWAAGFRYAGGKLHVLLLRWNGHAWRAVRSPRTVAQINGLGFAKANYGWAVGANAPPSGHSKTYILHWNGRSWR
jgi:hypothetical protein